MPDPVIVIDAEGRIQNHNARTEALFGYTRAELGGQPLALLLASRPSSPHESQVASFFTTPCDMRIGVDGKLFGRRKDSVEFPIEVSLSPVRVADVSLGVAVIHARAPHGSEHGSLRAWVSAQSELDCATVCIVAIDARGCITHVNEPWRRFAHENSASDETAAGVGQNYLAACERTADPDSLAVAAGIRHVLSGRSESFDTVYSCHSAVALRWFHLQVRRPPGGGDTAVLTHINITNQRLAEARSQIQGCVADGFASRKPLLVSCRELAHTTCESLAWDFFGIWEIDVPSWTLHCVDLWTRPGLDLESFAAMVRAQRCGPGIDLTGRVWSSRQALWVTDFEASDVPIDTLIPPAALAAGFRSGFAFPIKYDDDVLLVVSVFGRIRQQPDPQLLHLLEISGVQLATSELRDRAEHRAEAAQSEADSAREQLEAVLQCVPALVVAIDRNGALRFANRPPATTIDSAMSSVTWRDHFSANAHPRIAAALQTVLDGGEPTHHDATFLNADGSRAWATNYIVPLRSGAQIGGALIVSHDTTQLKRAHEELVGAQRLAAIGTLAAGVAHEINTPIQFVGDSVSFLKEASQDIFGLLGDYQALRAHVQAEAPPQTLQQAVATTLEREARADLEYLHEHVPQAFERCEEGIARVTNIVRSMKEFSHPAQKEMAPVDLNRAISATLTVARNEYKYVADLETELGELPPVTCHVNDINQAVLNIVVNAAHAMADKHAQTNEKGLITVRTRVDNHDVVIEVSDTGGGIPEEVRHRIFEPFFTTKEVGRGTGQGLSIARATINDQHAGELTFETRMGVGTTFFIRLPIAGKPSCNDGV